MPITANTGEDPNVPYANFAFHVAFEPVGSSFAPGAGVEEPVLGGFSEISGIEALMEHKVIKAGGRNYGPVLRAGPVSFSTVVMKRGIVKSNHLWTWWSMVAGADGALDGRPSPDNRCNVLIGLLRDTDTGEPNPVRKVRVGWRLRNAMPIKFRVGDLSGKGTEIAVEEIHVVHEGLEMAGVVQ